MSSPGLPLDPVQALAAQQPVAADPVEMLAAGNMHAAAPQQNVAGPAAAPGKIPQWALDQGLDVGTTGAAGNMIQGATFGLGDEFLAAGAAAQHNLMPFLTGKPTTFNKDYGDVLAGERAMNHDFQQQHPYRAMGAQLLGSVPTLGAGAAEDIAANAPTLGKLVLNGARTGAVYGGLTGFGTGEGGLDQRIGGARQGAEWGTVLGAATPVVLSGLIKGGAAIGNLLHGTADETSAFTPAALNAAQVLSGKLSEDSLTPQDAAAAMRADPTGQTALVDLGGQNSNTARLGRALVTMPGAASKDITDFVNTRNETINPLVNKAVSSELTNSPDLYQLNDALNASKLAEAKPLYQAAGIPANPADFASAPVVDNPQIQALLAKSKPVQRAISQAKGLSAYSDLPDNSMVLLDQAYKNIGGKAAAAVRAGDGAEAFGLNNERVQLLDAMTGGDPNHPYHAALAAYSGGQASQDALELGSSLVGKPPGFVAHEFNALPEGDKQFARIGFAGKLQEKLGNVSDGQGGYRSIYGNPNIRASITHVFGQDAADNFGQQMDLLQRAKESGQFLTGGSQTANKIGEVIKSGLLKRVATDAVTGGTLGFFSHGLHGALTGAVGLPVMNIGKDIATTLGEKMHPLQPDVAQQLATILTAKGPEGAQALEDFLWPLAAQGAQKNARNAAIARQLINSSRTIGVGANQIAGQANAQ